MRNDSKIGESKSGAVAGQSDTDSVWLVKSSDRILGPYRKDEIEESLRGKSLAIIDEVTRPKGRWRVVRDEPAFHAVVDEIRRGQMSSREDTEIQSQTQSGTETQFGELTPTPTNAGVTNTGLTNSRLTNAGVTNAGAMSAIDASRVTDAEFVDITPARSPAHAASGAGQVYGVSSSGSPRGGDVRQYGISYSDQDRHHGSPFKTIAWICASAAVAIALYLAFNGKLNVLRETTNPVFSFDQILADANAAWAQGEFFSALNLYRQADQLRPGRPEVVARLAPLLIHLEGATVNAKRALAEVAGALPSDVKAETRAELEMGLGLAALVSDDLPEAQLHYQKAQTYAPTTAATFGGAMASFLAKQYTDAARALLSISEEPAALLLATRAFLASDRSARGPARKAAEASIAKLLLQAQDYRQEAYVVSASLDVDSGNRKSAAAKIREAIDTDPDMTTEHRHDPYLYLEPLSWRALLPVCRRLGVELKSPVMNAFLGLCLFKAGDREEASQVVSFALAESPEEPLLQSVNAYILLASARLEDAKAALKLATKTQTSKLALLVQARVCTRSGDAACAEKTWQELASMNPPILVALTSLAEIRHDKGDEKGAKELMKRARQISPTYRPVLAFKADAHR